MKIAGARAWVCDIPVLQPRSDAVQSFLSQETIFVEVTTTDGTVGRGYSYTIGIGGTAVLALVEDYLIDKLSGLDAACPEEIWRHLYNQCRSVMVGPITALALAAIDTAVWDARAKALGLPVFQLAGGAQHSVPVYDTEGGWLHFSIDELAANAAQAIKDGRHGVKVKVGKPDPSTDVERLRAVREAIGPAAALMVDANQGFTRDEAVRRAHLYEPFDLTWFEEPLAADDVEGHAILARSTSIPIAVGETMYSLAHFREYLSAGAASVVQPDVARIGGITPWLKVAHLAEAFGVPAAPHFLMELHVSLSAAVPNGRWVEWIPQLAPVTSSSIAVTDGRAHPPRAAGLGISWDDEAIERLSASR